MTNVYKHSPAKYALALLGRLRSLSSLHYKLHGSNNAMCGQTSKKAAAWTCFAPEEASIMGVKMCAKCDTRHARMLQQRG